jgi:hypothetical protein
LKGASGSKMIDESIDYLGRRMISKAVVLTEMCLSVILDN